MKLLFDQNLSHKLVRRLADLFPNSTHVREVGLKEAEDPVVWEYAKQQESVIVSKDADFHQRSFVLGFPPKVMWVRLGNCTTAEVEWPESDDPHPRYRSFLQLARFVPFSALRCSHPSYLFPSSIASFTPNNVLIVQEREIARVKRMAQPVVINDSSI